MNKKTTRTVTTVLTAAMVCTSATSCQNMSDETRTVGEASVFSAVAGGLLAGGITALATGGDWKAAALAAAGGAAAGAIVGVVWGQSVVKDKQEYASTEDYLNANIEQLDTRIAQATKYNSELKNEIAAMQKEKKKYSDSDYKKLASNIDANLSLIDQDISTANLALKEAGDADINKLRQKLTTLESERDALSSTKMELEMLQTI